MTIKRTAMLFTASALLAGIATASTTASASFWRRVPATTCLSQNTSAGTPSYLTDDADLHAPGFVTCGVTEDSSINAQNAAGVWVDVKLYSSGNASAMACLSYYSGGYYAGGECGSQVSTTAPGFTSLNPPVTLWNGADGQYNYPYLYISTNGLFTGYGVYTN